MKLVNVTLQIPYPDDVNERQAIDLANRVARLALRPGGVPDGVPVEEVLGDDPRLWGRIGSVMVRDDENAPETKFVHTVIAAGVDAMLEKIGEHVKHFCLAVVFHVDFDEAETLGIDPNGSMTALTGQSAAGMLNDADRYILSVVTHALNSHASAQGCSARVTMVEPTLN